MQNQQLIEYIKTEKLKGTSYEAIKSNLLNNGWTLTDIESAWADLNKIQTIPIAPLSNNTSIQNGIAKLFKLGLTIFLLGATMFLGPIILIRLVFGGGDGSVIVIIAVAILPFILIALAMAVIGYLVMLVSLFRKKIEGSKAKEVKIFSIISVVLAWGIIYDILSNGAWW